MVASRQRNYFVPISIKQETALFWKSMFLYFGCESKCALFEYRSRRLNIKLFAAVVYFCLVDCYTCKKCKNVRDWKDHGDKKAKHFSLNFLSSKLEQMAEVFNCHGSAHGRIQFSCKCCLYAPDKKTKVKQMDRKIKTKIVTALMFSHSDNLKTWIKCHDSNTPSPPPLPHPAVTYHWRCQSSSLTEYTTFFFLLLFSVDGIYRRVAL